MMIAQFFIYYLTEKTFPNMFLSSSLLGDRGCEGGVVGEGVVYEEDVRGASTFFQAITVINVL